MTSLFEVKATVRNLLTCGDNYLRDCDRCLILSVWQIQSPGLMNEPFRTFAKLFIEGKLAAPESIRRTRQKIQEEHPSTRGELYHKRHALQEDVKEELSMPEWKQGGTP